jgi:uncharacterized protein YndB with AHSA1/START domain
MASSQRSVERLIHTPAARVFGVLTDIDQHALIDGSGTVQGRAKGPAPLTLESRFTMGMAMRGFPYRTTNHVVEYEPDRLIAWETIGEVFGKVVMGGQRWRYELEPQGEDTLVTETYDWGAAKAGNLIGRGGMPNRMEKAMSATLERLAKLVEN